MVNVNESEDAIQECNRRASMQSTSVNKTRDDLGLDVSYVVNFLDSVLRQGLFVFHFEWVQYDKIKFIVNFCPKF